MFSNSISSPNLIRPIPTTRQHPQLSGFGRRRVVLTRAGPSTTSYIFAFVFPLSLLAVTAITSIRIADKLDQKFLEELAVNQAILEAEDGEEREDDVHVSSEEEEVKPVRRRNRPTRQIEQSSI
ncbi:hypothetical protein SASPL_105211 [Salvia splendens]|uniref:Uncharacterized protein n=1 Tax=Salvia splendens TaxID=180675 RepID=A0A8X8YJF4_SALSN|nr:uncharacterized protein LOC121768218 [Salvia splendens]KAG6433596.1 hypothetical protein SASPL_105211 [Salvia splendens]